jgi:hypothetical protein
MTFLCHQNSYGANLTTTNVQASGANWTAAIWKTNSPGFATNNGAALAPVAANTYEEVFNGITIGNGVNNTRVRNPATAGLQTFPGQSLRIYTNAELRAKQSGAILNFPGVGGNPGLIMDGGLIDAGDDATFIVTGRVQIASQSYISHGANGGGGGISANRALNVSAVLSGSGTLVIMNSGLTLAQQFTCPSNTFSGQWIVQCGWLQGTATNSLGTNSITVDPNYTGWLTAMPNATSPAGPARFEVNYDLNSAGTLTIANGGTMRLHQNCAFTAATINGTALSAGTHYYSELVATFGTTFEAGGSGAITVQPYGTLPALGPIITTQPGAQVLYAGGTAHFSVVASDNGAPPLTFQWKRYGTNLLNGGNISGATNATLTVSGVSASDATGYTVLVANTVGNITSTNAPLTIVSPSGEAVEAAVIAANPVAFYQFNETGDPATNNSPVFDFSGGFNGTYGTAIQNGSANYNVPGPLPADGLTGFSSGNTAARFTLSTLASRVTVNPWNLNTNAVTLTAWINPNGPQNLNEGLVFSRASGTTAGLCYSSQLDPTGNANLAYNWNNEFDTYSWLSGLTPPSGQWSFVAVVITPTNATIYLMNTSGLQSASRSYNHVPLGFAGASTIGDDSGGASGNRVFGGSMDDVSVFKYALSKAQLVSIFTSATGPTNFPPLITGQPTNSSPYAGQTATLAAAGGGTDPLTIQWQSGAPGSGVYTNVPDGGRVSGATTRTILISNLNSGDSLDYVLTMTNPYGSATSSVANISVQTTSPAEAITMAVQQAAGFDWDNSATPNNWSDNLPASTSAASKPGSTYEVLAGGRLRTPINPTVATFPGNVLTVDGDGVWNVNPPINATIGEIRFKQPTYGVVNGTVIFKQLRMNGGQLDNGADSGGGINTIILGGQIDILTNAPFNNDNGADRGFRVDALLTGTGTIEYHGYNQTVFQPSFTNTLNITCPTNTFTGKWNVVMGILLGSAPGSLGTNGIVVGPQGALETTYDLTSPDANMVLNGRMFLHQNDTFRSLIINGLGLAPGTYTFAQLNTAYATNFPSVWTNHFGVNNITNGSGSITVLVQAGPVFTQQPVSQTVYAGQTVQLTGAATGNPPITYQWRAGAHNSGIYTNVTDSGTTTGSTTTNLTIANAAAANGGDYVIVASNAGGSVTSVVAVITVVPTGPALNLTLDFGGTPIQQAQGVSWDSPNNWSDGQPASVSALSNPGSTYDVIAGARLRTPTNTLTPVFPGTLLRVEGDGVFVNSPAPGATVGEIRFKQNAAAVVRFPRLVMAGGQLDTGDNSPVTVTGEIDILANTPIYADSAAGQDRAIQIDAWMTGSGSIEWRQFSTALTANLNITCPTNTYNGKWHVVQGVLLGSGANCLGTNDMTVDSTGVLETLYNMNDSAANLTLNGQLFLHQTDTFHSMTVNGVAISPGTYTAAQLSASAPANFPASWPQQSGSSFNSASGSITVLAPPPGVILSSFSGGVMTLNWSPGTLLEATDLNGPWTINNATAPYSFVPTGPQKFFRIQLQ